MSAVPRVGARMIILDEDDRVLLIEEAGTDPAGNWHHWLTPGGGVEAGESWSVAATREVVEETGVRVVLGPAAVPFHEQRRTWAWRGTTYDQTDHIFAARVSRAFEPRPLGLTAMEQETVVGTRWWTIEDLRASNETFVPAGIADLVATVAADESVLRPRHRPAGRTIVLDPSGSVLLVNVRPDPSSPKTNWITPGGGCEAGETPAVAAVRELFEETGIHADLADDEPASIEHAVFPFRGRIYDQIDHFYLVRLDARVEVDQTGLSEGERAMTVEYRWWTLPELRSTSELYWPLDLVSVIEGLGGASMLSGAQTKPAGLV